MDERLQRLEGDKDSLQMQVSILIDQIEAQTDKMADLERTLSDRAFQLQKAEDNLQKVNTIVTFLTNFSFDQHSAMS
jgi:chromosome segregation ATPase